jgi:sugar phosphate isomerase/epimerase
MVLLRNAGFSAVSPVWSEELPMEALAKAVDANGMAIQSLHAPHGGLTALWDSRDPMSPQIRKRVTDCIDSCARFQIPVAVVHCWQGLQYTFPGEPLDYSVFDAIVAHALRQNVSIAFENLEGEEYLEALMTRYRELPGIGFCWDSGHDHCYPHKTDFLEAYGHRLLMTHLNDNLGLRDPGGVPSGLDDLHFLPYDGTISWEAAISRLKHLPKQEILNFEIKKRSHSSDPRDLIYDSLTPEAFFRLAGERARKIADLYEQITDTKKA